MKFNVNRFIAETIRLQLHLEYLMEDEKELQAIRRMGASLEDVNNLAVALRLINSSLGVPESSHEYLSHTEEARLRGEST